MRKARKAYTLFELVLVCAILVILTGVAVPLMHTLAGKDGLTGKAGQTAALDTLKARLAEARELAVSKGKPYRVSVVLNKGNYRVAPDSAEFWGGSSDDGQQGTVIAGSLPSGSCFCPADGAADAGSGPEVQTSSTPEQVASGSYETVITFRPDGTPQGDGQIGVKTVGAKRVIFKIRADTGIISEQEG